MASTGVQLSSLANGNIFSQTQVEARGKLVTALEPAAGATVFVYAHDTIAPQVQVYADEQLTLPMQQPLTVDADGNVPGFVANGQVLDLVVTFPGVPGTQTLTVNAGGRTAFNDRGQIQYNTTYQPWDSVLYFGHRILFTAQVTTGAGTNGTGQPFVSSASYFKLGALGFIYAADYGVVADGVTDMWSTLQSLMLLASSLSFLGQGLKIILPSGYIQVSKTLIIPSYVTLIGLGQYATTIRPTPGWPVNQDIVQFETNGSASQAAILGVPANTLVNAFYSGIRDLAIHGTFIAGQNGINVTTNPTTSLASGDPAFDPTHIIENVHIRQCGGDGYTHTGRSGVRLTNVLSLNNGGNGYTLSFDTQVDHCQAGFNFGSGFYFNHFSCQGAGNKSFNNGNTSLWSSGIATTAGQFYYDSAAGQLYSAINSLGSSTTAPSSDPTNFALWSLSTPQAWGCGVYMDSGAGEITFDCDCQQNSAWSWYFHGCAGAGINFTGTGSQSNFQNVGSGAGANRSTNTTNYAEVCFDGCSGVIGRVGVSRRTSASYALRLVNGATRNDLAIAGDTTGGVLTPDSFAAAGSGNRVNLNGSTLTDFNLKPLNFQSGSYTLALTDLGAGVELNSATGVTLTIPTNATVPFPNGCEIRIMQGSVGTVTVSPAGGVTLRSLAGHVNLSGQYAVARLWKRSTDDWYLEGNLA